MAGRFSIAGGDRTSIWTLAPGTRLTALKTAFLQDRTILLLFRQTLPDVAMLKMCKCERLPQFSRFSLANNLPKASDNFFYRPAKRQKG